jgi:hypothetical protein
VVRCLLAIAALLLAGSIQGTVPQGRVYHGDAFDVRSGELLYRESHYLFQDEDGAGRLVLYRCPDGAPFARKYVYYGEQPQAPVFALRDARIGYREGLRRDALGPQVYVQNGTDDKEKRALIDAVPDMVADAGFDEYVRRYWDVLQRGETMRFPFLVPSRLQVMDFKVRKHRSEGEGEARWSVFRLQLGSWWAFVLPHIDVAYRDHDQRLMRFEGLTNIRDGSGRNLSARIEFDPAFETTMLSRADFDEARRQALATGCDG